MRSSDSPTTLRRLLDVAWDAAVVALVLVGALLVLRGFGWGPLWILLGLVGLAAQLLSTRRERGAEWSPLGRALVLRTAAVTATAVTVAQPGHATAAPAGHPLAAALAAAFLVGAIACEPFVARAARFTVPVYARLPGLPAPPQDPKLGPLAVAVSLGVTAAGLLLAVVGASAWWWVLLAVLAVVPVAVLTGFGRAKIVFTRSLRSLLPKAVARYAPDFVLYTSRPDDASYQIMMWLPYLQRSGLRFVIVARNRVPAAVLAGLTDVPVVEARGMADLDGLVVPSLKAAFYVNASSGNGAFVRFQHLTHVYLGHGDSDKPPSYNPTHAMYDIVFAAGPAAARRYAAHGVRIPAEKFAVVGRPQVEDVLVTERPISSVTSPVVLYAPTWRGHVEETMLYSLPSGERIVAALLRRGATVIFRPHPFSYDFPPDAQVIGRIQELLRADARTSGRAHLWGAAAEKDRGILDCINASDAMVSDVSSVVSDYLYSGKPFAMIAVPSEPDAFVAEFPVAQASYVVRGDLADLDARLEEMLGGDQRAPARRAIRADYLGDFPAATYADAFVDAVRRASVVKGRVDDDEAELDEQSDGGVGAASAGADTEQAERDGGEREPSDADGADGSDGEGSSRGRDWSRLARLALRVGLDLGATAVAVVALGAVLLGSPAWLLTLIAAVSVLACFWSVPENVTNRARWPRLLTEGDATRTVLITVLAVAGAHSAAPRAYAVITVLLVVTVVVERRVRAAWGRGGLQAAFLPAALRPVAEVVPRGLAPMIGSLLILLSLAGLWLPVPAGVLVALIVAFFGLVAFVVARSLWRAAEVGRAELRLRGALADYAPEFAVYFASTVGAHYQLGMWLPYFVRTGRRFVIVTRTAPMLRQIEQLCLELGVETPVVHRPTLRSVEDVIVDSMTTAFYVNNAVRNTHFIERRELTHVWLNHGDSEKPACFNPVHAIYDLIFAAGQAGIDRYARHGVHIPREKFRIVGRPQVERITPAKGSIAEKATPSVLYAPTWQGPFADTRVYSLPVGRQIVQQLLGRGARVIFRAHPFNYRYPEATQLIAEIGALLDADRAATGREHLWGPAAEIAMTVEDCFNASDAMVSDVSAVVSDYLHSNKPFAMVSIGRSPEQLVVDAPAARAAYVLREDLSNLEQVCNDLLGPDPLAPVRKETKVYYLGEFPDESYADGFLDTAREVIGAGRQGATVSRPAEVG